MRSLAGLGVTFVLFNLLLLPSDRPLAQQVEERASPERLMQEVIEIWSQHDTGKVDLVFAADGVYEDVALGEVKRGRAEIKTFLRENFVAVPDFKVELTRAFSTGDRAVCEWVMSGTHTGDYTDLPATGKSFSVRGASVVLVEGGRIKHWTDYYDMYTFLAQLGVLPASPGDE
jgi:steroid delta-isomerase-like uncharacterized protein